MRIFMRIAALNLLILSRAKRESKDAGYRLPMDLRATPVLASARATRQGSRCDAGAAPATVRCEIAADATDPLGDREGAAVDEPEPGDLLADAHMNRPSSEGGGRMPDQSSQSRPR